MKEYPKILIGSPTGQTKNYCWLEFICNLKALYYPQDRMEIFIAENSNNNSYAKYLNGFDIKVHHINPKDKKTQNLNPLVQVVCQSHNVIREYAIKNKFDYIFHVESDVMVRPSTLIKLLAHQKKVCSAMYFHGNDKNRNLLLQTCEHFGMHRKVRRLEWEETLRFVDGTVKNIHACGIGATLIHKSIFRKFPFRFLDVFGNIDKEMYPDSYFYEDLAREEIPVFVDTDIILEHKSQDWGANPDFYR